MFSRPAFSCQPKSSKKFSVFTTASRRLRRQSESNSLLPFRVFELLLEELFVTNTAPRGEGAAYLLIRRSAVNRLFRAFPFRRRRIPRLRQKDRRRAAEGLPSRFQRFG